MENEHDARLIEALREFKVSDRNIAKYAPYIPVDDVWKLIKEWRVKEQSSSKINAKGKYCNKVYVTIGKKCEEEKANVQDTLKEVGRREKPAKKKKSNTDPKRFVADEKEMRELFGGKDMDTKAFAAFMEKHGYSKEKKEWVKYH